MQIQNKLPLRLLLLGATGQVGQAMQQACPDNVMIEPVSRAHLDLSDLDGLSARLEALIHNVKPQFIVNAAAYTAVDQAETDQVTAQAVNALAPGMIAMLAAQHHTPLLHYSTDYVFDGNKSHPYVEDDHVHPLSVYGASKLAGERAVLTSGVKALVLRTSWVFSEHGGNFLKTMLRLASTRDRLQVVDDQVGSPTSAALIADVSFALMRQMVDAQDADERWGLYHMTAASSTSWYAYARYLISQARALGACVQVTDDAIVPVPSSQFPSVAQRPKNSRLDCSRLQHTFNLSLPDWQSGVDDVLKKILCGS